MRVLRSSLVISIVLLMLTLTGCSPPKSDIQISDVSNLTSTSIETEVLESLSLAQETTSFTVTEMTQTSLVSIATETESKVAESSPRIQLDVKNIQQLPDLPSGCEITSTTIVLNYLGFDVDKLTLIDYMSIMEAPDENGLWESPWNVFIGSPYSTRFGVYSTAIKDTIESYFVKNNIEDYEVLDLKDSSVMDLYSHIDDGYPVIVWATISMNPSAPGKQWLLQDGTTFTWISPEHCLVLIGYDLEKETVIFSDPFDERGTVEYPYETFETRYNELFRQALVIRPIEEE